MFALGEAFLFDWSEDGLLIGGLFRRLPHEPLGQPCFLAGGLSSQGHEISFDAYNRLKRRMIGLALPWRVL